MKQYQSDDRHREQDIIVGYGHVVAVRIGTSVGWVLPGNVITADRNEAKTYATKLDKVIQYNVAKYNRSLI